MTRELTQYDIARAIRKLRRNYDRAVVASGNPKYETKLRATAKAAAFRTSLNLLGVKVPSLAESRKAMK